MMGGMTVPRICAHGESGRPARLRMSKRRVPRLEQRHPTLLDPLVMGRRGGALSSRRVCVCGYVESRAACLPAGRLPLRPPRASFTRWLEATRYCRPASARCIQMAATPAVDPHAVYLISQGPILQCAISTQKRAAPRSLPCTLPRRHPCCHAHQPSHPGIVIASVRLRDAPPRPFSVPTNAALRNGSQAPARPPEPVRSSGRGRGR